MAEEKQVSASGYIVAFFTDLENLMHHYALYRNQLLKTTLKTDGDRAKIDDMDKIQLSQNAENLKYFVFRTYLKFSALKEQIIEFKKYSEKIEALYGKIKNDVTPDTDLIENYCLELNKLFVEGIVSTILVKARDLYGQYAGQ